MTSAIGYVRPLGPDAGARERDEADHLGALHHAASRRGWELRDTIVDCDGVRDREVLRTMNAGAAELLVLTDADRWVGPEDRLDLATIAEQNGWRVVCTSTGFEQGSEAGELMLAHYRRLRAHSPLSDVPIPPARLRRRVTGSEDLVTFDTGGSMHVAAMAELLESIGAPLATRGAILDFGCGCGRLLRHLGRIAPGAQLVGADTDSDAIEWVRANLDVEAFHLSELPPSTLPGATFDVALAFSVFTHLDEAHQDAWLEELHRVMRPDGVLVASINHETALHWHRQHPLADLPPGTEDELDARGIAFWRDDGWEQVFPDWYHTTHHRTEYVREHWGRWFELLRVRAAGASPLQDLVALRRKS